MAQPPHIDARGLTKIFASGNRTLHALADVSLEADRGAFVSIIGPSGGGKTTLLKLIGGLLEPTTGRVSIDDASPEEARRRKEIGYVFQDPSLLPWRTVLGNVQLSRELNPGASNGHLPDPQDLLETVGLAEFQDYYPHQLSGGMNQRVALARALAHDPSVLLMDEPLGALDEMTRIAMRYELLRIWEISRKTVVLVTHSIPEAVLLSDTVVVMSSRPGRILDRITIDLPRPRGESAERSSEFLAYTHLVRETLSKGGFLGTPALEAWTGS